MKNVFFVTSKRTIFLLGIKELIPKNSSLIVLCNGPFHLYNYHAEENNIIIMDMHQLYNGLEYCLDFDWSAKVAILNDCLTVNTFDINNFEIVLHENDTIYEIEKALHKATSSSSYVSDKAKTLIAKKFITSQINIITNVLTKQERTILELIGQGNANAHISEKLHISKATVSKHKNNIKKKLNCNSIYELVYLANQYLLKQKT